MRILMMTKLIKRFRVLLTIFNLSIIVYTQSPTRVGTTAAEFLSIGYGPAGCAIGDAYVSSVNDISSIYWNPAGLSFMDQSEAIFSYQPWLVDINTFFTGAGIVIPKYGTLAIGLIGVDYGEMKVTTVDMQQGTGEFFSANDYAFSFSYGRRLVTWFGFGASVKYINSSIWHSSADAFAVDLGVQIQTPFFSPTRREQHGLKIGMSLANYGTKMQYSGIDLMRSVDISPDEAGNYKDSQVNFATDEWDLPIIFRAGMSIHPISTSRQQLTIAADALHVNNNSESVNMGAEYMFSAPGVGKFFLRGGYRALFLKDSEFGPAFGFGVMKQFFGNMGVKFDYAYRDIGLLGYVNTFGMNVMF
jgi:hypothetical protein